MIRERLGAIGFTIGALSAPLALLASGSCGISCGSCPAGGACVLGAPIVFGAVYLTNLRSKAKVESTDEAKIEEEEIDDRKE
jgi:hypothetical protein